MPIKFIDEPKTTGKVRFLDEEPVARPPEPSGVGEAPVMAQIGRGMMDVYQGSKQLAMNLFAPEKEAAAYNQQLSEEVNLYNKNNPGFQVSRLVGSLATPLVAIPGAAVGAPIKTAVAAGAALGAASAITSPVTNGDYWVEKGKQAGIGATIGAVIPVAGLGAKGAVKWVDEITKPLYKKGVQRDVSKFLNEYVSENKDMITKAINKAIEKGDDRPVGQIIADAAAKQGDDFGGMIVRLEKDLARESDALKSLYARQSISKRAAIESIAGTEDDLVKAIAKRAETGAKNYADAFKVNVQADDDLINILDNKYAQKAVKDALDIAKVDGAKSHSQILHNVKIGLDKQLNKSGDDALSMAEKKAVNSVKTKLLDWLEESNPQYKMAREQYALDSKPINKMLVGQEIKNSFITALEKDSPSKFAEGLKNAARTIKKATGDSRFKSLDDVLSKKDIAALNKIKRDLSVETKAKSMAAASKPIKGEITGEVSFNLPHILSRPVVITNHLLKTLGKDKTPEYKEVLIGMLKDPVKFTKIYGGPSSSKKTQAAMDIVKRLNIVGGSQLAAAEEGQK